MNIADAMQQELDAANATITQLREQVRELMNAYVQPCCGEFATCERQCVPLIQSLRAKIAAAHATREADLKLAFDEHDKDVKDFEARIASTHQTLIDCAEFVAPYVDVRDGEDGRQLPNAAMSLQRQIEETIDAMKGPT